MHRCIPFLAVLVSIAVISGCVGQNQGGESGTTEAFTLGEARMLADRAVAGTLTEYMHAANSTGLDAAMKSCEKVYSILSEQKQIGMILGERAGKCALYMRIPNAQLPNEPVADILCQWNVTQNVTHFAPDAARECEGPLAIYMSSFSSAMSLGNTTPLETHGNVTSEVPPEQTAGTVDSDFAVTMPDWTKTAWGTTIFPDNHISGKPRIVEINMKGEIIWQYLVPTELAQYTNPGFDVEVLPNNDVLFVLPGSGVYEVDRPGETVWSFKDAKVSHDADRLANGNTLVVFGNNDMITDSQVREIDPSGKVVWSWKAGDHFNTPEYNTIYAEGWTHTNAVERLANGNTMISMRNFDFIVEVDKNGDVVRKIGEGILTEQHDPVTLENGNILVADHGRPQSIMELDSSDNIVWQFILRNQTDYPARDADKLSNGDILITTARRILEVTPEKEIVWEMKLTTGAFTQAESASLGFYKAERLTD